MVYTKAFDANTIREYILIQIYKIVFKILCNILTITKFKTNFDLAINYLLSVGVILKHSIIIVKNH